MRGPGQLSLHLLLLMMIGYNIIMIDMKKTTCSFTVADPTVCDFESFCTETDNCTAESSKCCCQEGYDQTVRGNKRGPKYSIECVDRDECFINRSICGHEQCVNTVGSYICVEFNGTTLKATQRTTQVTGSLTTWSGFNTATEQPTQRTSPVTAPYIPWTGFNTATEQPTQRTSPVTAPYIPRTVYQECSQSATQQEYLEKCSGDETRDKVKDPICPVLEILLKSLNESCQKHNITKEKADDELVKTTERLTQAFANFTAKPEQVAKGELITGILYNVEQNVLVSFLKTPRAQKIHTIDQEITMKPSIEFCGRGVQSFSLNSDDNIMEVPCSLVPGNTDGAVLIAYKRSDLFNGSSSFTSQGHQNSEKAEFNSQVVSGTITNAIRQNLSSPIIFSLSHLQPIKPHFKAICVFWDPVRNTWSDDGCETQQSDDLHTNCSCNHLSSFALLVALEAQHKIQEDSVLTILSYIGLSLSLLCLFLSLLTFILFRSLRGSHTSILAALCGCLFLGQFLFMVGIRLTGIKLLCAFIAGCLQFSFLSAFCWMSVESFLLFMTVRNLRAVNYMASRKSNFPVMCLFGFGIPAVVVGITAAVCPHCYGTESYCWLAPKILWSFLGPVCIMIITNTVLLVLTVHLLRKRLASVNTNVSTLKNTRLLTFKAVAQLFVLGCTWGIGYFQFIPYTLVFSYLFTICNSIQGVYIFLVHCLLNQQVREEYRKLLFRKKKQEAEVSTLQTSSKSGNTCNVTLPMSTISSTSTENKAHWM